MPDGREKRAGRAWRGGDGGEGPRKPPAPARNWRQEREAAGGGGGASPRRRFARAFAALLACCAVLVGLILLLRPGRTALLVLVGAGYAENLAVPHNTWGLNALDRLTELSRANNGIRALFGKPAYLLHPGTTGAAPFLLSDRDGDARRAWAEHAKTLLKQARGHTGPVVVVLALHGAADATSPYFLADEARPGSPVLRVGEVLETLAKLDDARPKVVIVDPTAMTDAWNFGVTRNDFALGLERVKIPRGKNLWVFCSSAPGQRSWVDERAGMTAFGRALVEGLAGQGKGPSGAVTLASLCRSVGQRTRDWAATERSALQTPVLLCDRGAVALPRAAGDPRAKTADAILAEADKIELLRSIDLPPRRADDDRVARARAEAAGALAAGWAAAAGLEDRDPADPSRVGQTPAAYAPTTWRRLREALVRREQLLRAGYDPLAARNKDRNLKVPPPARLDRAIAALPGEIRAARMVALSRSETATLAMPAVAGREPAGLDGPTRAAVRKLLQAPNFEAAWRAGPLDPLRFFGGVLDDLNRGADPGSVADASGRLDLAANGLRLSPSEVQFLAVLRNGLPGASPPGDRALAAAVALRVRAERSAAAVGTGAAFSYPEEVAPWVRAAVDAGDRARRSGEDLLFSTRAEDHEAAETLLRQAGASYDRADQRAGAVREALTLRDAVLADLPFLSHWIARRGPAGGTGPETPADRLAALWDEARALARTLDAGPADDLGPLGTQAKSVRERFAAAWKEFDTVVNGPRRDNLLDPHQDALAREVPVADRAQFRVAEATAPKAGKPPRVDPEADRTRSGQAAAGQARLALASWGEEAFGRANDLDDYATVLARLRKAGDPTAFADALRDLGPQLARCTAWLPAQIARESADDPRLASPLGGEVTPGLLIAERLARVQEPALDPPSPGPDPTLRARKRRLVDLLTRQAERAWSDHYYAGDEPSYLATARAYLDDAEALARDLFPSDDRERRAAAALAGRRKALSEKEPLALAGDPDPVWTSEPELALIFRAESGSAPGAPALEGHPVAWSSGPKSGVDLLPRGGPNARTPLNLGGDGGTAPRYAVTLTSARHEAMEKAPPRGPKPETATLASSLFFRGRRVTTETPVRMFHLPEIRLSTDRAATDAGLLVRGGEVFGGPDSALAFVFDNSGSMRWQAQGEQKSKYMVAVDVLRNVLRAVPLKKETRVSLWTYGGDRPRPDARSPEDRTQRVFPDPARGHAFATWDPDASPRELLDAIAWSRDDPPRRYKDDPPAGFWNGTPLLTSMKAALGDLVQSGRKDKLMVVMTDGADSIYTDPEELKKTILRDFADKEVSVNVVLFRTDVAGSRANLESYVSASDPAARAAERKNLTRMLDELEPSEKTAESTFSVVSELNPRGSFFSARLREELRDRLESFLARRPQYRVLDKDLKAVSNQSRGRLVEDARAPVSSASRLPPGLYYVEIDRRVGTWVEVAAGQTLILDVTTEGSAYTLQRGLVSEGPPMSRPWAETDTPPRWRLSTSPPAPAEGKPGGEFLASLEDLDRRAGEKVGKTPVVRQVEPRSAWFEVVPPGRAPPEPFHVGLRRLENRGAPTWAAYLPEPPTGPAFGSRTPTFQAWWSETPAPATEVKADSVAAGASLDDAGTTLEALGLESHHVSYGPDEPPKAADCLVVRLRHAAGKVARVDAIDLGGPAPAHEEHRYYRSVGRVTALYWPVTPERFNKLRTLRVSTVDRFKADKATKHSEIKIDASALVPRPKAGP